jgi:hypothetical protein
MRQGDADNASYPRTHWGPRDPMQRRERDWRRPFLVLDHSDGL